MAKKKRVLMKGRTISKVGIYNRVNFSEKLWDVAIELAKEGVRRVPAFIGHTNFFTYNPSDLSQQKTSGFFKNVKRLENGEIESDLDTTEDIEESIENEELYATSIEGILHNPILDENGIWQADGMTLTGVALLGRDQPAVAEARLSLEEGQKGHFSNVALSALTEEGDALFRLTYSQELKELTDKEEILSKKKPETNPAEPEKTEESLSLNQNQPSEEMIKLQADLQAKADEVAKLTADFDRKLALRDRFNTSAFVALSRGAITPADYERELSRLSSLGEEEIAKLESKWKESPAVDLTKVTLAGKSIEENQWRDPRVIENEIQLRAKRDKVDFNKAAAEFYNEFPEAKKVF